MSKTNNEIDMEFDTSLGPHRISIQSSFTTPKIIRIKDSTSPTRKIIPLSPRLRSPMKKNTDFLGQPSQRNSIQLNSPKSSGRLTAILQKKQQKSNCLSADHFNFDINEAYLRQLSQFDSNLISAELLNIDQDITATFLLSLQKTQNQNNNSGIWDKKSALHSSLQYVCQNQFENKEIRYKERIGEKVTEKFNNYEAKIEQLKSSLQKEQQVVSEDESQSLLKQIQYLKNKVNLLEIEIENQYCQIETNGFLKEKFQECQNQLLEHKQQQVKESRNQIQLKNKGGVKCAQCIQNLNSLQELITATDAMNKQVQIEKKQVESLKYIIQLSNNNNDLLKEINQQLQSQLDTYQESIIFSGSQIIQISKTIEQSYSILSKINEEIELDLNYFSKNMTLYQRIIYTQEKLQQQNSNFATKQIVRQRNESQKN